MRRLLARVWRSSPVVVLPRAAYLAALARAYDAGRDRQAHP